VVFVWNDWNICLVNFAVGLIMITIGAITFYLYGLLIGLGILAATGIVEIIRRKGLVNKNELKSWSVGEVMVWAVGLGMIGARIYHVVDLWKYYMVKPKEILMLWNGGLGIYGGILGGILGALIYSFKTVEKKSLKDVWKRFLTITDVVVMGVPLGQTIGRWGNFFNQELYGLPTSLPWGIYIRPENRLLEVMEYERFHPLFLYESLWCLFIFLILWRIVIKKKLKIGKGGIVLTYLGLYGLGRFMLEYLRIESWQIYGVNVAQGISAVLIGIVVSWWVKRLTAR